MAPSGGLRVVAAGGVPFVIEGPEGVTGLGMDVWRAIAERSRLDHTLARAPSVEEALERVLAGQADVAVGPISITAERARRVAFTQPYFHAGLSILSRTELHPSQLLAPFLTFRFAAAVGFLICVLGIVGALIWLAERRRGAFPEAPGAGIASGLWFALVTMTTVGYGDYAPRSALGRTVTAIWMLIAVLSLSSLTAGIASSLTLAKLETGSVQSLEQLGGQRVAVVVGSTGAKFVSGLGLRHAQAANLEQAVEQLVSGRVAAVLYDAPMLEYFLKQHPDLKLHVSAESYRSTGYGFAVARGSALYDRINGALLELDGGRAHRRDHRALAGSALRACLGSYDSGPRETADRPAISAGRVITTSCRRREASRPLSAPLPSCDVAAG